MRNKKLNLLGLTGLGLTILGGGLFGAEPRELLYDNFAGTAFDSEKWTRISFADVGVSVRDGVMTLPVTGWHHFNGLRSQDASFDFHAGTVEVTVDIVSYAQPDPWGTGNAMSAELWFALGPDGNRDDLRGQDPAKAGFSFAIRWRPGGQLDLYSPSIPIPSTDISGIPSKVIFEVDATTYSITFEGATFTSGTAAGSHTLSGIHGIGPFEVNRLTLLQELRGFLGTVSSSFNSVRVTTEALLPVPTDWAGFPFVDDFWVDTEGWLGMLYVGATPWIYSVLFDRWIYLPEENVFAYGAWLYAPR